MNILVLVAHPDDEALGCGGTIARFVREGHDVRVMFFTDGGSSRGILSNNSSTNRVYQVRESAKILGFKTLNIAEFPSFSAGNLQWVTGQDNAMDGDPLLHTVQAIEWAMAGAKFVPDMVITHSPWCLNIDHKTVYQAVEVVFREKPVDLLCFEIPSSSDLALTSDFRANCWVGLTDDDFQFKLATLSGPYGEEMRQFPHPRSLMAIEAVARGLGFRTGTCYAEAFMTMKRVI